MDFGVYVIFHFEFFQGQIRYGVIGYLNAPFFFGVNNATGVVSIRNDLKTDIQRQYEVSL